MPKDRLLAYTDAVLAIILTIMVIEFKVPHTPDWSALYELRSMFSAYILSFIYLTIYWNNHHHVFQNVKSISGRILWRNSLLLFALSLIPFATAWMEENHFAENTVVFYGIVLLFVSLSFNSLLQRIRKNEDKDSILRKILERDRKGKASIILYVLGIIISFFSGNLGFIAYLLAALIWIVPDRRMERLFFFSAKKEAS